MNDILNIVIVLNREPCYKGLVKDIEYFYSSDNLGKVSFYSGHILGILYSYVHRNIIPESDYCLVSNILKTNIRDRFY